MCLLPITLERFIAIVFPFHHQTLLTKRNSWIMCIVVWLPNLFIASYIYYSYQSSVEGSVEMQVPDNDRKFYAHFPTGIYLSRDYNVNPKVFVQWGQEFTATLLARNFSSYGELLADVPDKTVFMRNIRLKYTEAYYTKDWGTMELSVDSYNSHAGNTSFDQTINFYSGGDLIVTLIKKMVYIEGSTGKPTKLPAAFLVQNPEKGPSTFNLAKVEPDSMLIKHHNMAHVTVRPSDLDFNNHVGHPVYVDYIFDAAHEMRHHYKHLKDVDLIKAKISCIDVEYKYSVTLGKPVDVQTWDEDEGEGVRANFIMYQSDKMVCLGRVEVAGKLLEENGLR